MVYINILNAIPSFSRLPQCILACYILMILPSLTMLQEFKISNALVLENKTAPGDSPKKGRPSFSTASQHAMKKARGHATKPIPGPEIRFDGMYHFPGVAENRNRCKMLNCSGTTVLYCKKCNTNLCLTKNKTFFIYFHTN